MMASPKRLLAICGSTRNTSANLQLLHAVKGLAGKAWQWRLFDIGSLPYFNQDTGDGQLPETVSDFRQAIAGADAVVICTPEYVFSLPGILKNALEWTVATVLFQDKPTALITASSSGEKAHESLLLVMRTLGAGISDDSCLLVSGVRSKLDAAGSVSDPELEARLKRLVAALEAML